MEQIDAAAIRRSIRRFNDYANALVNASVETFADRLDRFIYFCSTDTVFSRIHKQMSTNTEIDLDSFLNGAASDPYFDCANLRFPPEPNIGIPLMYMLLLQIQESRIDIPNFVSDRYPGNSSSFSDCLRTLEEAIIQPLLMELEHKLEDVETSLPKDDGDGHMVPSSVIQIIHNHGNLVQQQAIGSSNSQNAQTNIESTDVLNQLKKLRSEILSSELDSPEKEGALQLVDNVEVQFKSGKPQAAVVTALLKALPQIANIASIASTVIALCK